jgi:hypothetical protein
LIANPHLRDKVLALIADVDGQHAAAKGRADSVFADLVEALQPGDVSGQRRGRLFRKG